MTAVPKPGRRVAWIVLGVAAAAAAVGFEIVWTAPVREAVRTYTELIEAGNRRNLTMARSLCTARYLATHDLRIADKSGRADGMVGLPRSINKNFQAWREGADVWLCPTNRVGPVYRFVKDAGRWKFDGVVGQLMPWGRVEPMDETD